MNTFDFKAAVKPVNAFSFNFGNVNTFDFKAAVKPVNAFLFNFKKFQSAAMTLSARYNLNQ